MKNVTVAILASIVSTAAHAYTIDHVSLAVSHELTATLKQTFSIATKDMSCYVIEGEHSNGASFPVARVGISRVTTEDGKVVEFPTPIEAGVLPGEQGDCDLFNYAIEGKDSVTATFSGNAATRIYELSGINDPTKW